MTFTITGATYAVTLNTPKQLNWVDDRGLKHFHFWTGENSVYDIGKDTESITLIGQETSTVSLNFWKIDVEVEDGEEVTIAGISNDQIDTTWYIEDYNYTVTGGLLGYCDWSITLEKSY